MAVRAKDLRYVVDLSASGELSDENGVVLEAAPERAPAHLLPAALACCSLKSPRLHAKRAGAGAGSAAGSARTLATKRRADEGYALVDGEVELAVKIDPEPERAGLAQLLALAERDCFVGSSLTATPDYRWTVNGRTTG